MDSDALYQPFPLPTRARGHVWRHKPATRRPRHFHAEPELNLVTAGTARFGMGDLAIDVGPGDLLWWPPGQDHVLLDASVDFDLFVVGVTPELSDRVLGGEGAPRTRRPRAFACRATCWPACSRSAPPRRTSRTQPLKTRS